MLDVYLCGRMSKSVEQINRNWQSLEDHLECSLSSKYFEHELSENKKEMDKNDNCVNVNVSSIIMECGDGIEKKTNEKKKKKRSIRACRPLSDVLTFTEHENYEFASPKNYHNQHQPRWPEMKPFRRRIIYSIETKTDLSTIRNAEQNRREYILC